MSYYNSFIELYEIMRTNQNISTHSFPSYSSGYSSITFNNYDHQGNINQSAYLLNHISGLFTSALLNLSDEIVQYYQPVQPDTVTLVYKDIKDKDKDKQCSICMEDYEEDSSVSKSVSCLHLFHEKCLTKWIEINKTCPICRSDI